MDQDYIALLLWRGSLKVTVTPQASGPLTDMVPSWASTTSLEYTRPWPMALTLVLLKGLKRLSLV